jgi:hypothetical protein
MQTGILMTFPGLADAGKSVRQINIPASARTRKNFNEKSNPNRYKSVYISANNIKNNEIYCIFTDGEYLKSL